MSGSASLQLVVPEPTASKLAFPGSKTAESLHLTLAFFGPLDSRSDWTEMLPLIEQLTSSEAVLEGEIDHYGRWAATERGEEVFWAGCAVEGLGAFRESMVTMIETRFPVRDDFGGWAPHITLDEVSPGETPEGVAELPLPVRFEVVRLRLGREANFDFALRG